MQRRPQQEPTGLLTQPNKAAGRVAAAADGSRQQNAQPPPPAQQKEEPAEAAVIKDLLQSLGHTKVDPRVVQMLIDYTYQTTSDILREAEAINIAAGGTGAELTPQDIALASAEYARRQPQPPTLQELHALARRVNAQPLTGPSDKQHGIKLPPVADCLLSQNYQLRQRPRVAPRTAGGGASAPPPRQHPAGKQQPKMRMQVPQQWQPPPDTAGATAQPFEAPDPQQQGTAVDLQQQEEQAQGMDVDQEEI